MFRKPNIVAAALATVVLGLGASSTNAGHHEMAAKADIVDTAVAAGNFSTLATALEAGELVATLKSDGPFTVFAPSDAAFAKLPAGTVESLLEPENRDQLVAILTYHVVSGKVEAGQVVGLTSVSTVNGQDLSVRVEGETVFINDARVTAVDVGASNGVIHVIDTVLLPN